MSDVTPVIDHTIEEWPPFGLTEEPLASGLVLTVSGELDMATAPDLRERLTVATEGGATALVVDLRHVKFMDSLGLAAILHARSRLGDGGRLAIVLARDSYPHLVFETAGLPRSLALFESLPEAVAHVTA
jgi:anti-sigma B factor antagonist